MRAVVLVGGFGTRLRPLTLNVPKQMLPVAHRPMLERVVEHLGANGVTDVVLSLGYRPDAFLAAYPSGRCAGVALTYAVEPEPLDTAGAIAFAARSAGINERFVVVNGDVLTDLDLTALVAFHDARPAEATIALTRVDDPSRFGVVPTAVDGRVEAFVEKPDPGTAPSHWINAGTYVCEPAVLARIPDGAACSVERQVFPDMVAEGCLYAMESNSYWVDAGTPATYLAAQLDLVDGVRGTAEAALAGDVEVHPDADVRHSVVGASATIAAGAQVRDAVIGAGVRIGAGARVEASVVGDGAVVGSGAILEGLALVGQDATVPDNMKLDGDFWPPEDTWEEPA